MTTTDAPSYAPQAQLLRKGTKAFDILAAAPLILWYAFNFGTLLHPLQQEVSQLLVRPDAQLFLAVLSKGAVLLVAFTAICMLIARRPPQSGAHGVMPRVAGVLGTYLGVSLILLPPAQLSPVWMAVSAAMVLGGMGFACYSLLWLGRSFSLMAEARQLVTGGPYSIVRHPLYLGEEMAIVGAAIQFISPAAIALVLLQIGCQLYRMQCEEEVLEQAFPEYGHYKAQKARILPGIY
ncbi:MAG: isoprenylcysteine carboxylmethyltransferase family protein [Alphaproteobacteria bacterium]|nr:isoprenylcysteine carboxylmethyltransferase family protein [Alphaproteobacteria bacterium]